MKKCDVLEVDVVHGYFVVTTPSIYIYIKLLLVPCVFRARSGSPRISMEFWLGGGGRETQAGGGNPSVPPHPPPPPPPPPVCNPDDSTNTPNDKFSQHSHKHYCR